MTAIELKTASEAINFVDAIFKAFNYKRFPEPKRECEINSERVVFDYASPGELETLIAFYDNADYIGSGTFAWYNGNLCEFEQMHHFFKKRYVGFYSVQIAPNRK